VFAPPHSYSSAQDIFRLTVPNNSVFDCFLVVSPSFLIEFNLPEQLYS
jgi:hypothetical protein